jgi:excisionase family DNA binding protein
MRSVRSLEGLLFFVGRDASKSQMLSEKRQLRMDVPLADRFSLSPKQASVLTGIGISRVREAIQNGALNAHRNGASIVILPDDIKVWLKALPAVELRKERPD